MKKNPSRKDDVEPRDVPADDPEGTLERFIHGLRVVVKFGPKKDQSHKSSP